MPLHWRKARSWRGSLFPETLSQGSHIQPLHQLPVRDDQKGGAKPEHKGHARKEHGPDVPGKEDRLKRRVEMPRGDGQRKVLQRVGHTVDVKNEPGQDDGGQKAGDQPGLGGKKQLTDKQTIFYTRACNVLSAVVAMLISLFGVSIVAMNTFAFGIRCAGPFAAYGLGLAVPKATKNSGIISIICGTIAFVVWQIVGGGGTWMFLMPVVAGCLVSTISFFVVNWIEWGRGVAPAPSAYLSDEEVARKIAEESAGR